MPDELDYYGIITPSGGNLVVPQTSPGARIADPGTPTAGLLSEIELRRQTLFLCLQSIGLLRRLSDPSYTFPDVVDWEAVDTTIWEGIVIAYSRCFDGAHPLVAEEAFVMPEDLEAHQKWRTLRSKHYAHDLNDRRTHQIGVEIGSEGEFLAIRSLFQVWAPGDHELDELERIVRLAHGYATRLSGDLTRRVFLQTARLDPEERLKLPTLKSNAPDPKRISSSRARLAKAART